MALTFLISARVTPEQHAEFLKSIPSESSSSDVVRDRVLGPAWRKTRKQNSPPRRRPFSKGEKVRLSFARTVVLATHALREVARAIERQGCATTMLGLIIIERLTRIERLLTVATNTLTAEREAAQRKRKAANQGPK